ncbi:EAL domain-containing protein [Serratia entomophila]|jgi:EAL domain-containing protein (putative c-di-GMP-specific phosphodiesterase class I)|uniref:EAL domain-containing protein n=1 Tax=Serratia entomophila TaxID=42906 RepID=A0ABY5CZI5_9GAMM|nr:EAL domain-containing protein [Serratia entomophila]UIW20416.1 EAL domain-containing protein [Serratia entomophila]USV02918.1 EAL domain-containing protein [Serratia entomophila]
MKIQFEADFISSYVFQPVYSMEGRLLAVEILSRFNSLDGDLAMPAEIGINLLSPAQRIELFNEQLMLAQQHAAWFNRHDVLLTINIEEVVVELILSDRQLCQRIRQCPFIAFEISEGFPNLSAGKNNENVSRLSEMFTLWLDDFGSGKATLTALYDGLFDYVKIDKRFYWQLFTHQGYDVVIDSLLKNINLLCKGVIVGGIEKKEYFNKLRHAGVFGLQGFLWPSVGVDNLQALRAMPDEFNKNN